MKRERIIDNLVRASRRLEAVWDDRRPSSLAKYAAFSAAWNVAHWAYRLAKFDGKPIRRAKNHQHPPGMVTVRFPTAPRARGEE